MKWDAAREDGLPLRRLKASQCDRCDPSGPMFRSRGGAYPEVMLLRGSAEDLPLPNESADVALLSFPLSYCPDAGRAIQEVARIASGAQWSITDVNPETAERLNWQRSSRGPSGTVVMNEKRRRAEEIGEIFRCEGFSKVVYWNCRLERRNARHSLPRAKRRISIPSRRSPPSRSPVCAPS